VSKDPQRRTVARPKKIEQERKAMAASFAPKEYDGFYMLPDDEVEGAYKYAFFQLKDEYEDGKPINSTSVGDWFHVAFFKRNEDGDAEFDESFEAIFADPVVYAGGLEGLDIYGCFVRKTDKSQKWFDDYLNRAQTRINMMKLKKAAQSILDHKKVTE
jgi:hypothetical protein